MIRLRHTAILTAAACLLALPATAQLGKSLTGSGNIASESRKVGSFHAVEAGSAFRVVLQKGAQASVRLETDDNLLPYIETTTNGGVLDISLRGNTSIRNVSRMIAYVTYTNLDLLDLSGAAEAESADVIEADKFTIELSGAARVKLPLRARTLAIDASGASKVHVTGQVESLNCDVSGASRVNLMELEVQRVSADLSGASDLQVNVGQSISADVSGIATLAYKGSPRTIEVETSGAGRVRKLN